jgi:hypothetical protein
MGRHLCERRAPLHWRPSGAHEPILGLLLPHRVQVAPQKRVVDAYQLRRCHYPGVLYVGQAWPPLKEAPA